MDEMDIIESEKEWRRHLMQEQKELRKEIAALREELHIFKIKAFGFMAVLAAGFEAVKTVFK